MTRIFVPYTELQVATQVALIPYPYEPIELTDDYQYWQFLRERWEAGENFINIEHDCIPWPGAIESLEQCPYNWCGFWYHLKCHRQFPLDSRKDSIPLGCVKIGKEVIQRTIDIWKWPVSYDYCDQNLSLHARGKSTLPSALSIYCKRKPRSAMIITWELKI